MKYIVKPCRQIQGDITVPGDKSISHRAVMLAAIAQGTTRISGFLQGEDCLATLKALQRMGVAAEFEQAGELVIEGVGKAGLKPARAALDLGNSGTSMRLLTGLFAGQSMAVTLIGDDSLMRRPMRRVCDPLALMGAHVDISKNGTPPVEIKPAAQLRAINYRLPVASAQVKSAILLAGLYAQGNTLVEEPRVTRDHTERMLSAFGYPLTIDAGRISLPGGRVLQAAHIQIPADISSAAFFIVAACIAGAGEITVHNVGLNPTRTGVLDILRAMQAQIDIHHHAMMGNEPTASITARASRLQGIEVPEHLVPLAIDELPVICIAAACAQGVTRISHAQELRVKESDRISQVAKGLKILNIEVKEFADGLTIRGGQFGGGKIESGHDHRIAMAFAVASLRAQAHIEISDCDNVATSFPGFVDLANCVGLQIHAQ